jgi:hypothetical protein
MEIIRVHTGEGKVYARRMELAPAFMSPPGSGPAYIVGEQVEVPEGLSQQEAVDHFRAQGWKVEQDLGTSFANPEWVDDAEPLGEEHTHVWGDEEVRDCSLCGRKFRGMGNNPEPLAEFEQRCCDECNQTKVIPARMSRRLGSGGHFGLGKPGRN